MSVGCAPAWPGGFLMTFSRGGSFRVGSVLGAPVAGLGVGIPKLWFRFCGFEGGVGCGFIPTVPGL